MLSLRERVELDLEARLIGETLVLNRSLDPLYGDYIELNDLNVSLELKRDQVDDLMPTIEECEIFAVLEDMDAYRNEGMGNFIFGGPFLREVRINAKQFEGMITIHNSNEEVTYQMVGAHPRFEHHTNEQCNKLPPLLKDLAKRKEIDIVGGESTIWKFGSVGVLKLQDGCSTRILAHKLNLENLPSKISGEFLILILLIPVFNILSIQRGRCIIQVVGWELE
ncbi:hypothetical protein Tco_1041311 [Tanacetum coccineum]|uniref:Uncharacterized protein n=1 Tax=Tanacetum coccineum TaxID=301880 RepID=A0ABQ5GGH2_9ASTR